MPTRDKRRVLIVGAGTAGRELVQAVKRAGGATVAVGFLDDRFTKRPYKVQGLPVLGRIEQLAEVAKRKRVDQVYIAIPSAEGGVIRRIVAACRDARVSFRIVPRVLEIVEGRVRLDALREVRPEDLLGRAIAKSDQKVLRPFLRGKRVLVTGAAGSIGSELCRQIAEYGPAELVAVDWWENGLYDFENELRAAHPKLSLRTMIGNVQDAAKMLRLVREAAPDFVFHAAAYKHVPLMERFPEQALRNNVIGTWNVAQAARKAGVSKFVLVSTDKAVHPTSVMGATKAVSERLIHSLNGGATRFSCVRFGNVLASSGSVIPVFQRQIRNGGPVTLTHPDMVRYFMTIPEAVQLILHAGQMSRGGEIFVLDMGEPVKILDLAHNLIRLSGYIPDKDIEIVYTGIRPGEKLYEEVLTDQEGLLATKRRNIFVSRASLTHAQSAKTIVADATRLCERGSAAQIRKFLKRWVPSYQMPASR
ncbi:MAG TPA: nucleoside-diphosphate sugar epimerase/dehydratase [Polyangiales bacterium]